jgi:hypothetical protein
VSFCDESRPTVIAPGDTDFDTVPDTVDNCQFAPNADQADADEDAVGDACDVSGGAGATGHFQCYQIKHAALPPIEVTEQDRFGTQTLSLRFPDRLCAPADTDEGGIFDDIQHLTGYETLHTPFTRRRNQTVVNQFGTVVLDAVRRDMLMVPTAKSLDGPATPLLPPTIDHFQCYRVRRSRGQPRFAPIDVSVTDQFDSFTERLRRPYNLCVPANKEGEDPRAPEHPGVLLCYKARSSSRLGTVPAQIHTQFGPDEITVVHRRELCVPSFIQP